MAANVNSYISAGNAAVKNAYQSLAAARDNSPKHGELARKGMRARAKENMAAMKADAQVEVAKDKAEAHVKKYDIAAEGAKKVRDIKKGQQMAGKLASAAGMIALSSMPGPEQIKPRATDYSRSEALFRERLGEAEKDIKKFSDPNYKSELDKEFEGLQSGTVDRRLEGVDSATGAGAQITPNASGQYTVDIVDLGNRLQDNFGMRVREHSAFGGVSPVHSANSHHDYDEALDITDYRDDVINGVGWRQRTANLRDMLRGSAHEVLGPGDKGHDTHLHIGAYGGKINLSPEAYNYLYGGKSGGKSATFALGQ